MARKRESDEARSWLAARIRQAAADAGLDSTRLAEMNGVSPQCIRQWWSGTTVPSALQLQRLAMTLNKPVAWFYGEQAWLRTEFLGMCDRLMGGEAGDRAWEEEAGKSLTEVDRRYMAARGERFRVQLEVLSGGVWSELPLADRLAIVERMLEAAARVTTPEPSPGSPSPPPPASPGPAPREPDPPAQTAPPPAPRSARRPAKLNC